MVMTWNGTVWLGCQPLDAGKYLTASFDAVCNWQYVCASSCLGGGVEGAGSTVNSCTPLNITVNFGTGGFSNCFGRPNFPLTGTLTE
jgi:hypothetical protein